jgi:hypothetical protein
MLSVHLDQNHKNLWTSFLLPITWFHLIKIQCILDLQSTEREGGLPIAQRPDTEEEWLARAAGHVRTGRLTPATL